MNKELLAIRNLLLNRCADNGGTVNEFEIVQIFDAVNNEMSSNGELMNEAQFLQYFNEYKTQIKKRVSKASKLTPEANNNLKKLIRAGVTWGELESAVKGMYIPERGQKMSWAESTGNDTPTHILRNNNFERYLNKYFNNGNTQHTTTARDTALQKLRLAAGFA